jgi:hypothetical protein
LRRLSWERFASGDFSCPARWSVERDFFIAAAGGARFSFLTARFRKFDFASAFVGASDKFIQKNECFCAKKMLKKPLLIIEGREIFLF